MSYFVDAGISLNIYLTSAVRNFSAVYVQLSVAVAGTLGWYSQTAATLLYTETGCSRTNSPEGS